MSVTTRRLLWALLVAGFVFRLLFVAQDMRELVTRGPLYDDSFYCFEIARNIAQGHGSTFDGQHPTNGYQPLYVLMLVPLYAVAGSHATAPIYAALVVSALLNIMTGWILFRMVRRSGSILAAFFALVLWSFGPAIVRQAVNGLETSLAMLLIAASLEYYVCVFRRGHPTVRQGATLGLLLGLAVLARVDALLFVVSLGADVLLRRRADEQRRLGVVAAVCGAVLLPWCIASWAMVGTPIPESGAATRFLSEAYAPHDHPELTGQSITGAPPPLFLLGNLVRSVLQLGTSPVLQVYTRGLERLASPLRIETPGGLYLVTGLLALAALGLWLAARKGRSERTWIPAGFGFVFVYCGLLLAAYSFWVFGQIFYSRYYYPIFFVSIFLGALAFDLLLVVIGPRRRSLVAAIMLAVYGLMLPYMCMHRMQNGNYRFLHVVDWIATHTAPDARIGVFNSGAIAYFSDRTIINLDGKVNPAALAALRRGEIRSYVDSERLDYVIDHEWILGHFLLAPTAPDPGVRFARVDGDRALGVPGWGAYRIDRVVASTATEPAIASRQHP